MRKTPPAVLAATFSGLASLAAPGAEAAPLRLESPIACKVGETCFIQNYPDHDPGPGAADYHCGGETYNGHDGTDFRLPDMAAQRAGVAVLAAADGVVRAVRDGMADVSIRAPGAPDIHGHECGNGLLIAHADGWETQYCHMAEGSILVRPGQSVKAGQPLGRVGLSGETEFPHLHLSVRHASEKIDPFAFAAPLGAAAGACDAGPTLWSPKAAAQFAYRSPAALNVGFSSAGPSLATIEAGALPAPTAPGPALVAYARLIGLKSGDVVRLEIIAPDGAAWAKTASPPLDHDKAQWMVFAGRKRAGADFPRGRYRATVSVEREGRAAFTRRFEVSLGGA